jgi:ABC-2 type transport system permease protein
VKEIGAYRHLVTATARGQMQYRVSFLLETAGVFVGTGVDFVAILVFFGRVGSIGGWSMPEVALLYALVSASLGIAQVVGAGFEEFADTVRLGRFDQVLIRPLPTAVQVMASQLPLRRTGSLGQAAIAFVLAARWLDLDWGAGKWLFAAWTVLAGCLFFLGLFMMRAASCFLTVESVEVTNIVTYGGHEVSSYPMHVYSRWLQRVFVYMVPLAFVNYFPAVFLLGKPNPLGGPAGVHWLAMPLCLAVLAAGLATWRAGVRRYQSTGS